MSANSIRCGPILEPAQAHRRDSDFVARFYNSLRARAAARQCYATYGVHNPRSDSPCTHSDCVYVREAGRADRSALSGLLVVELDDVSRVQRLRGQPAAIRPRAAAGVEAGAGLRNLPGRNLLRQHMARPDRAKAR